MAKFGRYMGVFYAIGIFIGALGIGYVQSNQAYVQLNNVVGGARWLWLAGRSYFGWCLRRDVGGIKPLPVTEKIVPFMAVFYCICHYRYSVEYRSSASSDWEYFLWGFHW